MLGTLFVTITKFFWWANGFSLLKILMYDPIQNLRCDYKKHFLMLQDIKFWQRGTVFCSGSYAVYTEALFKSCKSEIAFFIATLIYYYCIFLSNFRVSPFLWDSHKLCLKDCVDAVSVHLRLGERALQGLPWYVLFVRVFLFHVLDLIHSCFRAVVSTAVFPAVSESRDGIHLNCR